MVSLPFYSVMGKMNKLCIYSETVQANISYNQVILNAFLTILDITCFVILNWEMVSFRVQELQMIREL